MNNESSVQNDANKPADGSAIAPAAGGPLAPLGTARTPEAKNLRRLLRATVLVAVVGLVGSGLLWQKLSSIQEQLVRQSADAGTVATEARAIARQSQELALETAAKQAAAEARLNEVSLQRTQLEELMQSLSRSRDENLVVDIESAVRLAQQQAQLTGSVEPLLATLKSAELRLTRAAQPRLSSLQRAIARDVARINSATLADTPTLLVKLDELAVLADELPLANAVGAPRPAPTLARKPAETIPTWWARVLDVVHEEVRNLVRVSRVTDPEAALLSPEQSFFVRENLKLRILNARLAVLSRQVDAARADLASASVQLNRYFDPSSRKTQTASSLLQLVQGQTKLLELPRVDDTLSALSTAAAGR